MESPYQKGESNGEFELVGNPLLGVSHDDGLYPVRGYCG